MPFVKVTASQCNSQGSIAHTVGPRTFYLNTSHIGAISTDGFIKLAGQGTIIILGGEYFTNLRIVDFSESKITSL